MAESSRAFLIRCWQEPDGDGELSWRFSLTFVNEKRGRMGFASLEALVAYLQQLLSTANHIISEGKQP